MRDSAVEFKYGKLIAGEVNYIHRVPVDAGEYYEGEILETTDGITYAKVNKETLANDFNNKEFAVVAQAVTLEDAGEVVCYKEGYFNQNIINVDGSIAADYSEGFEIIRDLFKTKRIFITTVKED